MVESYCYICNEIIDSINQCIVSSKERRYKWINYEAEELFECSDCSSIICFDHFIEIPYRVPAPHRGLIMLYVCDHCQLNRIIHGSSTQK